MIEKAGRIQRRRTKLPRKAIHVPRDLRHVNRARFSSEFVDACNVLGIRTIMKAKEVFEALQDADRVNATYVHVLKEELARFLKN